MTPGRPCLIVTTHEAACLSLVAKQGAGYFPADVVRALERRRLIERMPSPDTWCLSAAGLAVWRALLALDLVDATATH